MTCGSIYNGDTLSSFCASVRPSDSHISPGDYRSDSIIPDRSDKKADSSGQVEREILSAQKLGHKNICGNTDGTSQIKSYQTAQELCAS